MMSLFNCGVPRAEAELMVRYEVGMFNQRKEPTPENIIESYQLDLFDSVFGGGVGRQQIPLRGQ
jgi:hypothetical protein